MVRTVRTPVGPVVFDPIAGMVAHPALGMLDALSYERARVSTLAEAAARLKIDWAPGRGDPRQAKPRGRGKGIVQGAAAKARLKEWLDIVRTFPPLPEEMKPQGTRVETQPEGWRDRGGKAEIRVPEGRTRPLAAPAPSRR